MPEVEYNLPTLATAVLIFYIKIPLCNVQNYNMAQVLYILSFISVTIWYQAIIIKVSEEDFKKHND
jgi:hypothetical protein